MFTSSPCRRVGWFAPIALLVCGLLQPVSAQGQKVEVKRQTNTDPKAIQAMLTGSLSGKVSVYEREGPVMVIVPCSSTTANLELLDSNGRPLEQKPTVPDKSASRKVCHYEFRGIPAGTYTICTGGGSPCKELRRTLTIAARKSSTLDLRVETIK
jgi:hypothetical protein